MNAVLNILLEITIYSAVLYGAILLFKAVFRKHISAALNYAVWALLILRLLVPVTVDSGIHLFVLPDAPAQTAQAASQSDTVPEQGYSQPMQQPGESTQPVSRITGDTGSPVSGNISKQIKPLVISWQTVFVLLWGTGALGSLCYAAIVWRRLQQKIKRCGSEAPEYILQLMDECKRDMGIKAKIDVSVQRWLKSPALSVSLRPKLLLPEHMLSTMDASQIGFGIRHELAHCRRRDYLTNLLLTVLRCVYWFNPVVYLAFRRIQADMETACDTSVTSRLGDRECVRYITTMIDLSFSGNTRYVLGMGTHRSRKAMEKRVRGIIASKKTKPPVRIAAALLAGLMLIVCFTTACQPTPKTEAVAGRQEDILDTVTQAAFQSIEVPSHISEEYNEFPKLRLSYDADVILPDATGYPVTEVTKRSFSNNDIMSFIELLSGRDCELYAEPPLTKEEWQQKLTEAKSFNIPGIISPEQLGDLQKQIDSSGTELKQPLAGISDLPDTDRDSIIYVKNKDTVSEYMFRRNENSFSYSRDSSSDVIPARLYSEFDPNWETKEVFDWYKPDEPEISQQDAYGKALEYIGAMGIDLDLFRAEPCSVIKDQIHKTTGWCFDFTRTTSGLQTLCDSGGWYLNPAALPSCGSPWGEEICSISIDKHGLCSIWWRGASEVSRTVAESVQLEPFENVKQRITNQFNYIYGTADNDSGGLDVKVTKIRLGISMISVKDRTDIGEYVPTWYVSYSSKFRNEDTWWPNDDIMFSAIDGSYIEPRCRNSEVMALVPKVIT